ncbi:hypothetical protein ACFLS9_07650 [Bacteroidota bacterium]
MNSLYKYILFFLLILYHISSAQIKPAARQIALSHSSIALSDDVFAIFSNPGGLSQLNNRQLGIYYSPSPFGLEELSNGYAAYLEPFSWGNISIGAMIYGFELYKENKISISYSNTVYKSFFYGITASYQSISIPSYGQENAINLMIGAVVVLIPELKMGFVLENITRSTYGSEDNQIPISYSGGISYNLFNRVLLNAALYKEINYDASVRFGIEYPLVKYLELRFGLQSNPTSFSGGVGINYSIFEFDYAGFNHQDLGFTHQAAIIIHFSKNK